MSAFQLINTTDGNIGFKSGTNLGPGQSRYVDQIDLEMTRLQRRGMLVIKDVGPIFGFEDLGPDYAADVKAPESSGGGGGGSGGTITGAQLAALIASNTDVQAAIKALATTSIVDVNNVPLGRAFPV